MPLPSLELCRLGLFKALERFDATRGVPFGAYATPTIMGELRRHFRDHTWSVHVPRRAKDLRPAVHAAMQELSAERNRAPRVDEVALQLRVTVEVVLEALDANNALPDALTRQREIRTSRQERRRSRRGARPRGGCRSQSPPRERKVLNYRFYDSSARHRSLN